MLLRIVQIRTKGSGWTGALLLDQHKKKRSKAHCSTSIQKPINNSFYFRRLKSVAEQSVIRGTGIKKVGVQLVPSNEANSE